VEYTNNVFHIYNFHSKYKNFLTGERALVYTCNFAFDPSERDERIRNDLNVDERNEHTDHIDRQRLGHVAAVCSDIE
jgi:hypothetical protein